jgi:hypothetical protein
MRSTHPEIGGSVTGVAPHPRAAEVSNPQQLVGLQGIGAFDEQ